MANPPPGYTRVCPYLLYEDAHGAVEYLTRTFGFVQRLVHTGAAGRMHTELLLGDDGLVMLGQAGRDKLFGGGGRDRLNGGPGQDLERQ